MTTSLSGKRIAFVVANEGIEQAEFAEPWKAVTGAGATAELIAPEAGHVHAQRGRNVGRRRSPRGRQPRQQPKARRSPRVL